MSSGLASWQSVSDRQPQPMHPVRRSRRSWSALIRWSRSWHQAADRRAQSRAVGVRRAGNVSRASLILASGMPTRCEARMNATRRSMARG